MPYLRTSHGPLFFEIEGTGEPLVIVSHGGLGLDHRHLRPWLAPLGDRCSLVFVDHRGGGLSPNSQGGMTMDAWADDLYALQQHLGASQAIVLGHSYGGFIAQEYALRHPDGVGGLVLCCTACDADLGESALDRTPADIGAQSLAAARQLLGDEGKSLYDDSKFRALFIHMLPSLFYRPQPGAIPLMDAETRYTATGFAAGERASEGWSMRDHLTDFDFPLLVIAGRHDWLATPSMAEMIAEEVSEAKLEIFEESGHFPFVEEPDRFQSVVGAWLWGRVAH